MANGLRFRSCRRLGWIGFGLLALGLVACPGGDDDDADSTGGSCEQAAAHVESICGEGFGSITAASLRYDCEAFGFTAATKRCVLAAESCDEDSLGACDIHDRHWVCGPDNTECPPGLECNAQLEECTACDADADCNSGELCVSHWCVRDTEKNRQLQDVLDGS